MNHATLTRSVERQQLSSIVLWFLDVRKQGGGPFYCDPARVGAFAVAPDELAAGTDAAVFRLFVTLSMYQALRDVVIMRQQRTLPRASMRVVADVAVMKRSISRHVLVRRLGGWQCLETLIDKPPKRDSRASRATSAMRQSGRRQPVAPAARCAPLRRAALQLASQSRMRQEVELVLYALACASPVSAAGKKVLPHVPEADKRPLVLLVLKVLRVDDASLRVEDL